MSQAPGKAAPGRPEPLPPHNVEAEEALLGSLLIGGAEAMLPVSRFGLTGPDFFIHRHGYVFEALRALYEDRRGIDLLTLADELGRRGQLADLGGSVYLSDLLVRVPTHLHAEAYAEIVKNHAVQRRLIDAAGAIARLGYDSSRPVPEMLDQARRALLDISLGSQNRRPQPADELCHQVLDDLEAQQGCPGGFSGLPTGLARLDELLGGLQRGDLIIIAGRPGMGKSALAGQIGLNVARTGRKVLIFSLEMSGKQVMQRFLAIESGVALEALRRGRPPDDKYGAIVTAASRLAGLPLAVHTADTLDDIVAAASLQTYRHGLDLLIIDYVQLVKARGRYENRNQELAAISRSLKTLALNDLDLPLILVSQLSREVERRRDRRPLLSDLRDSGSLEQDADQVWFPYREDYYDAKAAFPGLTEVCIAKNRNGRVGSVQLYFQASQTSFGSIKGPL